MDSVPGQDSGVETEGSGIEPDQESNDSSLSSVSFSNPTPPVQAPPVLASTSSRSLNINPSAAGANAMSLPNSSGTTPEPAFVHPNNLQPPLSVTEDGYLGDCSSDGGNEKNFPMPAHLLKRLVKNSNKACPCHPEQQPGPASSSSNLSSSASVGPLVPLPEDAIAGRISRDVMSEISMKFQTEDANGISLNTCRPRISTISDTIDPPAGLSFQNLSPSKSAAVAGLGLGYQVNGTNGRKSPPSRKMKSSLKIKTNPRLIGKTNAWSHAVDALSERKLRTAASTNNTELMYNLIAKGVNVNASDEQQRTALHFSASKGYSQVVNLLLQYGADPNSKDILGNTALHLAACTNHIQVVTLLLRGGTDVTTLDNSGRTPMQLAQSKLKILQKNSSKSVSEMNNVKNEVSQVVDMMREYLSQTGAMKDNYCDLLNSFSERLQLHSNHDEIHSDLANLLDTLGNLSIDSKT